MSLTQHLITHVRRLILSLSLRNTLPSLSTSFPASLTEAAHHPVNDKPYCTMASATKGETIGFSSRRVGQMLKKIGYTPEFLPPNVLRLTLPALSHEAFDAQGQRQILCYLMKVFDITTLYWQLPTKDPGEVLTLYILNYEMNAHPSLYDDSEKFPLTIDNKIRYVKRSSRRFQIDLKHNSQETPLASSSYLEILVDTHTRRPKPFPDWWKEEYKFPEDGPKLMIEHKIKPDTGVLATDRRVHFTDTDENNHTNFVAYVRMCLDTFYENVLNRKYPNSDPVLLKGWIKNLKLTFKQDSVLGDILNIDSWEDKDCPNTFHFEMCKEKEVAVQLSLTFYRSLTESHL